MTGREFAPITEFSFEVNRSERSHQVRWLAPLLARPKARAWFLAKLECPVSPEEARAANVFHLCFPLRDIFTADYYQCRGDADLEHQFIAFYNDLFGLPVGFGVREVWLTAPNNEIRHPAAGGRAGWYEAFLQERISDESLYTRARNVRRMLGTEADVLLITDNHVVLVECKYKGVPSAEQYERHQMMGETLTRRLQKTFHFGMVVAGEWDPRFARVEVPHVLWKDVQAKLKEMKQR